MAGPAGAVSMPYHKLIIAGAIALAGVGVALVEAVDFHWRSAPAPARQSFGAKLGYLSPSELPNLIALLPPPPAAGSPEMAQDDAARTDALRLAGTARYALAAADAVRDHPSTVKDFECAFGTAITASRTPRLHELLSRVRLDVRAASYPAKNHFKRQRPFVVHNARTCYQDDENMARGDWSYPSARGAVGAAYALVLAKLRPDRAEAILKRGRDFGESRVICDQEWQSDVKAGQMVAAATLRRIEAVAAYQADLAAARQEVAAELAAGAKPSLNCAPEFAALASR